MSEYLDVTTWARRDAFEFFLEFDKPYFNVCTRLDITKLLEALKDQRKVSISLAYHYFVLQAANEVEPFRYRLRNGKVLVHPVIHGATTVLLPNETFTFSYFDYDPDFWKFIEGAERAVAEVKTEGGFKRDEGDDRIHCSVLPWIAFTSFSHARNWRREDSIPKISFGKFVKESDRTYLPISVEVHHALMDGLHVGRFLARLEELLDQPEARIRVS
jgi:chloramphenicol O-acetyltransferase type A